MLSHVAPQQDASVSHSIIQIRVRGQHHSLFAALSFRSRPSASMCLARWASLSGHLLAWWLWHQLDTFSWIVVVGCQRVVVTSSGIALAGEVRLG